MRSRRAGHAGSRPRAKWLRARAATSSVGFHPRRRAPPPKVAPGFGRQSKNMPPTWRAIYFYQPGPGCTVFTYMTRADTVYACLYTPSVATRRKGRIRRGPYTGHSRGLAVSQRHGAPRRHVPVRKSPSPTPHASPGRSTAGGAQPVWVFLASPEADGAGVARVAGLEPAGRWRPLGSRIEEGRAPLRRSG